MKKRTVRSKNQKKIVSASEKSGKNSLKAQKIVAFPGSKIISREKKIFLFNELRHTIPVIDFNKFDP